MSWNIKSVGPRAAVKAAVIAVYGMPLSLKMAIIDVIDTPPPPVSAGVTALPVPYDSASVHSYGHVGNGSASIGKLEVELFTAAVLPEPVAPAKDVAATEVVGSQFGFKAEVNTPPEKPAEDPAPVAGD